MQLIYEGTDITPYVDIVKCRYSDVAGGRCDSIDIELENAATWDRWRPEIDDRIEAAHESLESGIMYLNTILPENGRYRIVATALPNIARRQVWRSCHDLSLDTVIGACAAECGMDYALYGIEGEYIYPYAERKNEGCAAFLDRLIGYEGGIIKAANGVICAIGIEWAQQQRPVKVLYLNANQKGVRHIKREGNKLTALTVRTPWAEATAEDTDAGGEIRAVRCDIPARDALQAGRWARGLLLAHNRKAEKLIVSAQFDAGIAAMQRIDIESAAEINGEWLVDEVVHDLINKKTRTTLIRCIKTII